MRIGELARELGIDVQTIRYYEREGLVDRPSRTVSGQRAYTASALERLRFVRHCRSLEMPLSEIRRLLMMSRSPRVSCDEVDRLVTAHLHRVRSKRAELQALEARLDALKTCCETGHRVADCGILSELMHGAGVPEP